MGRLGRDRGQIGGAAAGDRLDIQHPGIGRLDRQPVDRLHPLEVAVALPGVARQQELGGAF